MWNNVKKNTTETEKWVGGDNKVDKYNVKSKSKRRKRNHKSQKKINEETRSWGKGEGGSGHKKYGSCSG